MRTNHERRALCRRESVGIFDVSHMLGVMIRGADRVEFMEKMCVADLQVCHPGGTCGPHSRAHGPRPTDLGALAFAR